MSDPSPATPLPRALHFEGGRHAVLLFHGLSGSPLELQFVARGLHRAGYSVHVPVMADYTYGLASPEGCSARRWAELALQHFDALGPQYDTVSVGGLCLGAVLALHVGALRARQVATVLGLSTGLHYDGWGNPWYTRLLPLARWVPLAPRIRIREKSPFGLKDERMRAWIERQFIESSQSDMGAAYYQVADLLEARSLIAATRRRLPDVIAPTLLLHALEDDRATPRSAYEVAVKVHASDVHVVILHDSYHLITLDREKQLVLTEMVQFLDHRLRESPGELSSIAANMSTL